MDPDSRLPARPTVSFVLATYNRGQVAADCLRRTLRCGLPTSQFSVIAVDNASTDDTAALIGQVAAEHANVRLVSLAKNQGPVAKNHALLNNSADLIVLLDDDAYPLPGAVAQMVRHFQDDPLLGAAVFDVTLPDGTKEASAFSNVFIGAGTALRGSALRELPRTGKGSGGRGGRLLPADFFMQAEEYDLSFRLLAAGYSVQRFWDMPLMHLKTPNARIGHRTTRLDVRNNLYLLAKYLPEPLCTQLAADWLDRYWRMALQRDGRAGGGVHKKAFLQGAAEGFARWRRQRQGGTLVLGSETIEKVFKFERIERRLRRVKEELGLRRIAFADLGKNMLAFHRAAQQVGLEVAGVLDRNLGMTGENYRGIPLMDEVAFRQANSKRAVDALILTTMSPVHAQRRGAALRRVFSMPVIDLSGKVQIMSAISG